MGEPGRPSDFTEEKAAIICERLSTCEGGLTEICEADDMPHLSTVYRWLHANPTFREDYAHAKLQLGSYMAFKAVREALKAEDPQLGRLAYDARKWAAGRLNGKDWGDKQTTVHEDPQGNNPFASLMEAVNGSGRPKPGGV